MADDDKTIWNDAAGVAPTGTSTSPWAHVLGEPDDAAEPDATPSAEPAPAAAATPAEPTPAAVPPAPAFEQEPHVRRGLGALWLQVDACASRFTVAVILVILGWVALSEYIYYSFTGPLLSISLTVLAQSLYAGAAVAALVTLALERTDSGDKLGWLEIVAPIVVTAALVAIGAAFDGGPREGFASLLSVGVFGVAAFGSLWLLYTDENDDVLFAELVRGVGFAFLMSILLTGGLLICILALDELLGLWSYDSTELMLSTVWGLVFPVLLLSQLPHHTDAPEPGKVYRAVAGYVVLPLCLLLLTILYGYIVRILVEGQMPSGQMNWFGSFALLVEICLWLGLRPIENRLAQLFVRWGWALLVPVVCVQVYGVWIRYCAYGLTTARFAGMACLVVGFFALVLAAWQLRPRLLFAFAAIVCAVVCLTPANIIDVPNLQQALRLREGMASGDDKMTYDSWDYLSYSGRGYFEPSLPEGVSLVGSFAEEFGHEPVLPQAVGETTWRSWCVNDPFPLDVEGFSRVYQLDVAAIYDGDSVTLRRYQWNDGTEVELDVAELIDWLPLESDFDMAQADLTLDLDDGSRLLITSIEVYYEGEEAQNVYVYGWYLVP